VSRRYGGVEGRNILMRELLALHESPRPQWTVIEALRSWAALVGTMAGALALAWWRIAR
jgi:hypothetical protein